jgi:stage II sporulation protein M
MVPGVDGDRGTPDPGRSIPAGLRPGFTLGFLVQQKGGAGIVMSIMTIVPQNLVYIPLLVIWSVIALNLSAYLVGRNYSRPLSSSLINYCLLMALFLAAFGAGTFIEAYLSPWFLSLLL